MQQDGVETYDAAIALVRKLRTEEIKTAVVSSSNNCAAVLEAAGIADLFDARVDGKEITALKLKGKPAPDAFLEAARRLRAEPARAIVVEDAIGASQRDARDDSAASSAWIATGTRRHCTMAGPMWW